MERGGILVKTKATAPQTACDWFARASTAVRQVIDESPGGVLVIHRGELPTVITDEDNGIQDFMPSRMKALPTALRARVGLRTAPYDPLRHEVLVIFDPCRASLEQARKVKPMTGYASQVKAALA